MTGDEDVVSVTHSWLINRVSWFIIIFGKGKKIKISVVSVDYTYRARIIKQAEVKYFVDSLQKLDAI